MWSRALPVITLLLIATSDFARADAELHLHFTALQRILAEQVFTQDGRKYVRGNPVSKCNFAYLENPRIAEEQGRLRIQARFSGRTAANVFGKCIGLGDSFDVTILASPVYRQGAIALQGVQVNTGGRDSFYIRRVRSAMAVSLARDFTYGIQEDARRIFEQKRENSYKPELASFYVPRMRVSPEAIVLTVDFRLAVK